MRKIQAKECSQVSDFVREWTLSQSMKHRKVIRMGNGKRDYDFCHVEFESPLF